MFSPNATVIIDRDKIRQALFPTESGPIIRSRLQNDWYKLSMGAFIHRFYPDVNVTFGYKNRSSHIHLAKEIDEADLRRELDHAQSLMYTEDDVRYLANIRNDGNYMFSDEYLTYLGTSKLPEYDLGITDEGRQFSFKTSALWNDVTDWEILYLQIVSALRTEALMKKLSKEKRDEVVEYTAKALEQKILTLRQHPYVIFSDFATRRAASPMLQYYIDFLMLEYLRRGQFIGTSNTLYAKELQTMPSGTNAHELPMVVAALAASIGSDADLREAPIKVLRQWKQMYGWGLSIILPDTFGSDWMFKNLPREFAKEWKGMRPDSMDIYEFGEKLIRFYEKHDQDSRDRLMIPSDSLNLDSMIAITNQFQSRIKVSSGWGTLLGNDTSLGHPSIVAKAVAAEKWPTVKLSDNLAKATGPEEEIERYKRVFGYTNQASAECQC